MTKGAGLEGSIYAGLESLTRHYLVREFRRDDGAGMRIERCLVDANWGLSTDVVYQFCRQSQHSAVLLPSHGRFVGASSIPFSEYKRKLGDRVGHNWRIPNVQGKRAIRHVVYDTNYWKSFIYARLAVPMGDRGCLSLFGAQMEEHRLFAEHVTAEYRVKTQGRGRTVDEWKMRAQSTDNHWLDCLVGCAVAASMQGVPAIGLADPYGPFPFTLNQDTYPASGGLIRYCFRYLGRRVVTQLAQDAAGVVTNTATLPWALSRSARDSTPVRPAEVS